MKKGARIPKELIRWRRCLPYIQTFLVLIFLTNTPPPAAASWADGDDLLAENSQGGSGINGLQPDHSSPDLISALAPHLSLLFGR